MDVFEPALVTTVARCPIGSAFFGMLYIPRRTPLMKTLIVGATIFFVASLGSAFAQGKGAPAGPGLTLTSPDFEDGGVIPNKYTQADPNAVSPSWNGRTCRPAP
jgi:hypothetical protein